jgi:hypothetical protein
MMSKEAVRAIAIGAAVPTAARRVRWVDYRCRLLNPSSHQATRFCASAI